MIISFLISAILIVIMADEEVDLNPTSTKSDAPKKRARPTDTAPESGPLDILVYPVVLKSNADTFTKSRIGRLIKIPDGQKHISDGTAEESVISAGVAHGLVVNFLAAAADDTIAKISSGDGEITEYKLVGDRTADYNVRLVGYGNNFMKSQLNDFHSADAVQSLGTVFRS